MFSDFVYQIEFWCKILKYIEIWIFFSLTTNSIFLYTMVWRFLNLQAPKIENVVFFSEKFHFWVKWLKNASLTNLLNFRGKLVFSLFMNQLGGFLFFVWKIRQNWFFFINFVILIELHLQYKQSFLTNINTNTSKIFFFVFFA